ncbi:MAG: hypothetical protein C0478_05655 [Planctomyces sp.]|nr:hypothetical protein [Planctomyces sp.]
MAQLERYLTQRGEWYAVALAGFVGIVLTLMLLATSREPALYDVNIELPPMEARLPRLPEPLVAEVDTRMQFAPELVQADYPAEFFFNGLVRRPVPSLADRNTRPIATDLSLSVDWLHGVLPEAVIRSMETARTESTASTDNRLASQEWNQLLRRIQDNWRRAQPLPPAMDGELAANAIPYSGIGGRAPASLTEDLTSDIPRSSVPPRGEAYFEVTMESSRRPDSNGLGESTISVRNLSQDTLPLIEVTEPFSRMPLVLGAFPDGHVDPQGLKRSITLLPPGETERLTTRWLSSRQTASDLLATDIGRFPTGASSRELRTSPNGSSIVQTVAEVSAGALAGSRTVVTPPRKNARLSIQLSSSDRLVQGKNLKMNIRVQNVGEIPLENVRILADLSPELVHYYGNAVEYEVGSLRLNEEHQTIFIIEGKNPGAGKAVLRAVSPDTPVAMEVSQLIVTDQSGVAPIMDRPTSPPVRDPRDNPANGSLPLSRPPSRPATPPDFGNDFPPPEPSRDPANSPRVPPVNPTRPSPSPTDFPPLNDRLPTNPARPVDPLDDGLFGPAPSDLPSTPRDNGLPAANPPSSRLPSDRVPSLPPAGKDQFGGQLEPLPRDPLPPRRPASAPAGRPALDRLPSDGLLNDPLPTNPFPPGRSSTNPPPSSEADPFGPVPGQLPLIGPQTSPRTTDPLPLRPRERDTTMDDLGPPPILPERNRPAAPRDNLLPQNDLDPEFGPAPRSLPPTRDAVDLLPSADPSMTLPGRPLPTPVTTDPLGDPFPAEGPAPNPTRRPAAGMGNPVPSDPFPMNASPTDGRPLDSERIDRTGPPARSGWNPTLPRNVEPADSLQPRPIDELDLLTPDRRTSPALPTPRPAPTDSLDAADPFGSPPGMRRDPARPLPLEPDPFGSSTDPLDLLEQANPASTTPVDRMPAAAPRNRSLPALPTEIPDDFPSLDSAPPLRLDGTPLAPTLPSVTPVPGAGSPTREREAPLPKSKEPVDPFSGDGNIIRKVRPPERETPNMPIARSSGLQPYTAGSTGTTREGAYTPIRVTPVSTSRVATPPAVLEASPKVK